ncbi:MAG: NADH-quinone oxidoreductase subunit B [Muribaculaceae bacterium]
MEVNVKSIAHADFKDNESLDKLVAELQASGTNVVLGSLDKLINWGRSNSIWPLTFATSCCGIEFVSLGAARFDMARFGWEVARSSPRQADFMMVAGTIVHRMVPVFRRLYDQLAEPKYVIACGSCAISGGPFRNSYHVAKGIEDIVPVDVFVPGCPPRPEAMIYGIIQLSRKMKVERFFGGVNRKEDREKFFFEHPECAK